MRRVYTTDMGQWSSGYDVALTTRRSPVQFRLGPFSLPPGVRVEVIVKHRFDRHSLTI